jgi:hypothetical protein
MGAKDARRIRNPPSTNPAAPGSWLIAHPSPRHHRHRRRAVALTHGLTLLTDNRKDFPMPELALYALP